ncbi:MAG: DNA polymerase II large subunit [Candidatus Diapherotrites archaeon]|nr:DNA polymerase II large subunit [Candidatus Diapherotrites archaeon]
MKIDFDFENLPGSENVRKYQKNILAEVEKIYTVAENARKQGFDVSDSVESPPATNTAERAEGMVGPKGLAKRFPEIMKENNEDIFLSELQTIREIIDGKIGGITDKEKALEQALRTVLAIETQGTVVSPIEGLTEVHIKKNHDSTNYVELWYAGPIRSAGGTAAALTMLWADYARQYMGLDKFKPTQDEIGRYLEEMEIFFDVQSRQAKFTMEQIKWVVEHLPVAITGSAGGIEVEVTKHRDLERVQGNFVREGMLLALLEGILLKAPKVFNFSKKAKLDWSWLEKILKVKKSEGGEKIELKPVTNYLVKGLAAGRPIFGHPMRQGGFRFRFGRGRNGGLMSKSCHPATMRILQDFLAVGTQLMIERPGKATCLTPNDTIDGPIIKLRNGDVIRVNSEKQAIEVRDNIKKILYLGDLLVAFGDFRKSGDNLVPVGYVPEWWVLEVKKALNEKKGVHGVDIEKILKDPYNVAPEDALNISLQLKVPLHPEYIHYYKVLNREKIIEILKALENSEMEFSKDNKIERLIIRDDKIKPYLEEIGLEHQYRVGSIIIGKKYAYALMKTFGLVLAGNPLEKLEEIKTENPLEILSELSGITIRDKGGTFTGSRMGRPEVASAREMKGNPHVLFPIGNAGGNTRDICKAADNVGNLDVDISLYKCPDCGDELPTHFCNKCHKRATKLRICPKCDKKDESSTCPVCNSPMREYSKRKIDLNEILTDALRRLGERKPKIIKGVKGIMSDEKVPEPIEKGILRAKHGIHIFKDGTARYEMLNLMVTHLKPKELGHSIEKMKELGYTRDYLGNELTNEEQIVEIYPQEILLSEDSVEHFINLANYLDELLVKFYGLKPYYNVKTKEDMIGQLVMSIAPHTANAVVGRVLGFTRSRSNFAHPYYQVQKRRNCDGEQDSTTLLLDLLLNFSKHYLPSHRGGMQDAPLVTTAIIDARDIDDEVYEMEVCTEYPLELYEKAQELSMPYAINIPIVKSKIGNEDQFDGLLFTHNTTTFNAGPTRSAYTSLKTMQEKVEAQIDLQNKIMAVDEIDAAERVLTSHFIRDIMGNMRAFARQNFRCPKCNTIFRRPPLTGKCDCGGDIILTISRGTVEKYLKISQDLVDKYKVTDYLKQRIQILNDEIKECFKEITVGADRNQTSLSDFI